MADAEISESSETSLARILALYPLAFPAEELGPLVQALFPLEEVVSLSAARDGEIVGHGLFSLCRVTGGEGRGALLGPLAVHPDHQRSGVGRAIIESGCARLAMMEVAQVFVVGDPKYYARFAFEAERGVATPFPIPDEWRDAWRSRSLAGASLSGVLQPPAPWMRPELWM